MIKLTLDEIVESRKRRATKIQNIAKEYNNTVVCLTLNVPGKIRVFELLEHAFFDGCKRFEEHFKDVIVHEAHSPHATGYEAYFVVDKDPKEVKEVAIKLEEQDELGLVFNYNVYGADGVEVNRPDLGYPERKCMLCDHSAAECMRLSTHTPEDVVIKVQDIIEKYYD